MLREILDTGGIWSVVRGLARNESAYKAHLAACDLPHRNDRHGCGHLSEETLAEFAKLFFETCIDQVGFMEALVQPKRLRERILIWTEEEIRVGALPPKADAILETVLYRGDLPRAEVASLLNTSERNARRITSRLL